MKDISGKITENGYVKATKGRVKLRTARSLLPGEPGKSGC